MTRLALMAGALAAAGLALSACTYAPDDKAFGARVRAYLLAHPEVLVEAEQRLQDNQEAQARAALAKAEHDLPRYRAAIERDPRDYVVNPNGKITVTEFYDYRCPHCANVAPKVAALVQENKDVRFVFKEMPIFGATSEHAARDALAVKADGGDYLGLYQAYMATHGLNDDTIDRLAEAHGAKTATLISPAAAHAANAQLADTARLFQTLSLGGTPAFIVGDHIISGEDMDAVRTAIGQERAKGGG